LTKYEVAKHLADYAAKFHLNAILSASISLATYDTSKQRWTVRLSTSDGSGQKTIVCKHFVQATGLGSQVPYLPAIEGKERFQGLSIHSTEYRNAKVLQQQGAKVSYGSP
jgi:cation diffusion facilitator CzcD-associated flavoprotein CzcO